MNSNDIERWKIYIPRPLVSLRWGTNARIICLNIYTRSQIECHRPAKWVSILLAEHR